MLKALQGVEIKLQSFKKTEMVPNARRVLLRELGQCCLCFADALRVLRLFAR